MSPWSLAADVLLGLAVLLAVLCAVGLAVMRDPWQRLQFSTPVVSWSAGLIAAAVWLETGDAQARIKVLLVVLVLWSTNAVLGHATARAVMVRRTGHWPPRREDGVVSVDERPSPPDDGATREQP